MLSSRLLTRAAAVPLYLTAFRAPYSTMASAVPPQSFNLDRNLFNDDLYTGIRSFWFAGLPQGHKAFNDVVLKRWWGKDRTPEEGKAFDEEIRQKYGSVLESIGPSHLALPPKQSHTEDLENPQSISAPLINEVQSAHNESHGKGAETLLALLLLLDQFPRNIYRDPEGLRLVYTHYDRLSTTLLNYSLKTLKPSPLDYEPFVGAPAYKQWFGLPLMHAEDLASQDECVKMFADCKKEAEEAGDKESAEAIGAGWAFAVKHREIVEKFGRFPHRNECLERENGKEEHEWLKTGDTFGVKQGQKEEKEKDEL